MKSFSGTQHGKGIFPGGRRLLAVLVAAVTVFCLLPAASVMAAPAGEVYIGRVKLDSATPYYHNGPEGQHGSADNIATDSSARFDAATGTLYLDGLDYTGFQETGGMPEDSGICAEGDLIVELSGENTVSPEIMSLSYIYGMYVEGDLTFRGTGSLSVEPENYNNYAQWCRGIRAVGGSIAVERGASVSVVSPTGTVDEADGVKCASLSVSGMLSAVAGSSPRSTAIACSSVTVTSTGVLEGYGGTAAIADLTPTLDTGISLYAGESRSAAAASPTDMTYLSSKYILLGPAYDVWVAGIQVTAFNAGDVLGSADDGAAVKKTVRYTAATATTPQKLTLDGASITASGATHGIRSGGALVIELAAGSENTVTTSGSGAHGIFGSNNNANPNEDITVGGSGELSVTSVYSAVCANNVTLRADCGEVTVHSSGYNALDAHGDLTVLGGDLTVESEGHNGMTVYNNIDISGGSVSATGDTGIFGAKDISISGGTIVTDGENYGIRSADQSISISGGRVSANGGIDNGLYAFQNINVSGGTVSASGSSGMQAQNGNITVSGGTAVSTGGTYAFDISTTSTFGLSGGYADAANRVVKAGDAAPGNVWTGASELKRSYKYVLIAPPVLSAPVDAKWDTAVPGKAVWTAGDVVAESYSVQLYKDGAAVGSAVTVTGTSNDFTSAITGTGSYTFAVNALAVGFTGSAAATSGTYAYTLPVNATVSPDAAGFDKRVGAAEYADAVFTLTPGSYTLGAIRIGDRTLLAGSDYTVSGNTYTVKKETLATLLAGSHTLTFDMSGGTDPTVTLTVVRSGGQPAGYNPPTGDSSAPWLWACLALLAGVCLAAVIKRRRGVN